MKLLIPILLLLVLFSMGNSKPYYKTYDMSDVTVIVTTHAIINETWKRIGGLKDFSEVGAFSYYDHYQKKYFVYLPVGASERTIGHEFAHILKWKGAKVKEVRYGRKDGKIIILSEGK